MRANRSSRRDGAASSRDTSSRKRGHGAGSSGRCQPNVVGRWARSCQKCGGAGLGPGRDQPHRGVGAVGGVAQQRPGERLERRQSLGDAGCLGPARVHALDADVGRRPAAGPTRRRAPPASAWCARRPGRRRSRRGPTRCRRRSSGAVYIPPDDTKTTDAPSASLQQRQQPLGDQVRAEHVAGQLQSRGPAAVSVALLAASRPRCAPVRAARRCGRTGRRSTRARRRDPTTSQTSSITTAPGTRPADRARRAPAPSRRCGRAGARSRRVRRRTSPWPRRYRTVAPVTTHALARERLRPADRRATTACADREPILV